MNLLSRVWSGIKRNKYRSILVFVILFLLSFLISGVFIVFEANQRTIESAQRALPPVFTVSRHESLWENVDSWNFLTSEDVHQIGSLPYVRQFDYSITYQAKAYYTPYWLEALDMGDAKELDYASFNITGVSSPAIIYLDNGIFSLVEGRKFLDEEMMQSSVSPILISKEFSLLNNLSIGSKMQVVNSNLFYLPPDASIPPGGFLNLEWGEELWQHPYNRYRNIYYNFEIVGIFDVYQTELGSISELMNQQSLINTFFMPNWRVSEIIHDEIEAWNLWMDVFNMHEWGADVLTFHHLLSDIITPFWLLSDYSYWDPFVEIANSKLPYGYIIDDGVLSVISPLMNATENINEILFYSAIIGVGILLVILTLTILLYFKERKHEIGIYMALGEKKFKIIKQFIVEISLLSLVAILLSTAFVNLIAEPMSESMLRTQIINMSRNENYIHPIVESSGFVTAPTIDELLQHYNITMSVPSIIIVTISSLLVIIASLMIPIMYILEQKPKELLIQAKVE